MLVNKGIVVEVLITGKNHLRDRSGGWFLFFLLKDVVSFDEILFIILTNNPRILLKSCPLCLPL